ncbi:HhH-GDP family DNA glycosylase [Winogradskyella sediminis]|uniref:hypothetical protein n=1 Tax=Winogradskyella sediminis TaxID=1382466 RepID=UPI000E22CBC5|nr:hypothetical protein [Winogradskyella sediminis]REG89376.1 hypothetical protein C8N41_101617 [Winogradskyella sediminis]
MQIIESARNLAEFIKSNEEISLLSERRYYENNHVGALFTDIVLQAGLNYRSVVQPRVIRVKTLYPEAYNIENLEKILDSVSLNEFLNWSHPTKLDRYKLLIIFCHKNEINTTDDLKSFLNKSHNRKTFLSIKGIGDKTLDYLMKLLNFDTIAVDRHIVGFLETAGLHHVSYYYTKRTFEFAADLLEIPRSSLDASVWNYMSKVAVEEPSNNQLAMQF